MRPTLQEVFEDINRLQERIKETEVNGTDETDKINLSGELAWLVCEIRRRYELTSGYYCIAEQQAADRFRKEFSDE